MRRSRRSAIRRRRLEAIDLDARDARPLRLEQRLPGDEVTLAAAVEGHDEQTIGSRDQRGRSFQLGGYLDPLQETLDFVEAIEDETSSGGSAHQQVDATVTTLGEIDDRRFRPVHLDASAFSVGEAGALRLDRLSRPLDRRIVGFGETHLRTVHV
ncbi:MAG TPA: hypothetical protein VF100_00150, partial [Thermoanaerobaculia bacterium]